jgi:hypothetical protein
VTNKVATSSTNEIKNETICMTDIVNESNVSKNVNRVNQNENFTQGKFDSVKKATQNCFHKCLISKLSFREMTNNFKSIEFFSCCIT